VKCALRPLNRTLVAPVKLVPLIVTLAPSSPLSGVMLAIVGAGMTVKLVAVVAVPPGVVTLSGPVVPPVGTVAWIAVGDVTVKVALSPLNRTAVVPKKFVPPIVTLAPTPPPVGAKLVIVGAGMTIKLVGLIPVPPCAVTRNGPVVAPVGSVASIAVAEISVKLAGLPLNVTAVAPVNSVPPIVTLVPTGPLAGVTLVIAGGGMTVKLVALVAVPPRVVTLSGPVVAPAGTVASIAEAEVTVKLAARPLNMTAVAPVKSVPPIVTLLPAGPVVGVTLVIVGGGITVKLVALVAVPPGVVTLNGPVVAAAGTVA
jgi:hypothetical protein